MTTSHMKKCQTILKTLPATPDRDRLIAALTLAIIRRA